MVGQGDFIITAELRPGRRRLRHLCRRFDINGAAIGGADEVQVMTFASAFTGTFRIRWDDDNNPLTPDLVTPPSPIQATPTRLPATSGRVSRPWRRLHRDGRRHPNARDRFHRRRCRQGRIAGLVNPPTSRQRPAPQPAPSPPRRRPKATAANSSSTIPQRQPDVSGCRHVRQRRCRHHLDLLRPSQTH